MIDSSLLVSACILGRKPASGVLYPHMHEGKQYSLYRSRFYHELIAWLYPVPVGGQGLLGREECQPRFHEIGQLAFIPAATPIAIRYPRKISMHRVSILRIAPELLVSIDQEHFRKRSPSMIANWDIRSPEISKGMRQLAAETLNPGMGSAILVESLAISLLIQLLRKTERCKQNRRPSGGLAK